MKHAKYMKMALALLMAGAIGGFVYGEWQGESKPVSSESTRLIDWSGVMQVDAGTYSMHILMFDGAVNHDDLGMLPVYHERIALETEYVRAEVKLIAGIYEPLLIDENIVVEDIGLAGDQARIITSVSIARGQPFLDIYLLPLRKDKNTG